MTGTVKNQNEKRYGFIRATDNKEYFFHSSTCIDDFDLLLPGKKVEFDIAVSPKGPRAENVRLI